ncbi:hypothetical protein BIW11_09391 [Tropilaelaps mercedesae]|uniref:Uncharacterized protein n=1 Tax=Tropilaelaps mercedesae TaxID=418985 RepID=A0A1V9XKJ0_9ACAR|nr:hypothetical protein BIW11_09391 [Tropilaelaps mercedesae]
MEHLRQLVYRRYAGPEPQIVTQTQTSDTSDDDHQDSLSDSILSNAPDLTQKYQSALALNQQTNALRTMPSVGTDSHDNENGCDLQERTSTTTAVENGAGKVSDFVWRERPVDKEKLQIGTNDAQAVDAVDSFASETSKTSCSAVVETAAAVPPADGRLFHTDVCSVDMARGNKKTLVQEDIAPINNWEQQDEKRPINSLSFARAENGKNNVTTKSASLHVSPDATKDSLNMLVDAADLNNNKNKTQEGKKTHSKQKQVAHAKIQSQQQQQHVNPTQNELQVNIAMPSKRPSSQTLHGVSPQKPTPLAKKAPSKSATNIDQFSWASRSDCGLSSKCQKNKSPQLNALVQPAFLEGSGGISPHIPSNYQYSVTSFAPVTTSHPLINDGWNNHTQLNGNGTASNHTVSVYNHNSYFAQGTQPVQMQAQPIQVQVQQQPPQCWQYEAAPGALQQHVDQFAIYSNSQQSLTSASSGGLSNSNSNSMDFAPCTSEMGRGVMEQWSGGRSSPVFVRDGNINTGSIYQPHIHMTDSRSAALYNSCGSSSEPINHNQQTCPAQSNLVQHHQQQQQPRFLQQQHQIQHPGNTTNGGAASLHHGGNMYFANSSARQLLTAPQPSVISIEEALAQLADGDAAMWHDPLTVDSVQRPSQQLMLQSVPLSSTNLRDSSEGIAATIRSQTAALSAQLSPPAKRISPSHSVSNDMHNFHGDIKKRALVAVCGPPDHPPDFPGGEQLRSLMQPDGTVPATTCYGLEVPFPQQVFVVLRNKLNSSAEVLDVNVEPSAARALRALRLPSALERPSLEAVQRRFAAFSNATGLPPLYNYSSPEQVIQPKEPRPRRVLALCCAYRLRFPALFFGATTGLENEQDLHDFVHCAAYSGVFNSWNLDQLNAIRKFKELVPPPDPQHRHSVTQTEAFLVIVAHLRVANVPSGRPPPTLRHVVLAPWAAREINDALTALSPAVQASSDALVVFNESRKLNTRTQNVTYCTFFAGVRLLDAAENGTYLSPQQLFDVPVQLSDDGAKVLRKLFSFMYEVYETCGSMDRYAALREARNRLGLDDATFFAVLHARRPVSLIRPRGSYDLSPEHVRRVVLGDGDKSSGRKEARTPRKSSAASKPESGSTRAIAEESCESLLQPGTPGTPGTP